ncbi:MAG: gliding motility-associated C-terminal domain-containing protein [Saprospirales bacterium]|nr:gliding motility-associated C-terminal domain-containing protein [Saprospirales bacterium]
MVPRQLDPVWTGHFQHPCFALTPGEFTLYLESINQWDCARLDTIPLTAVDTTDIQSGLAFQQCNGFAIQFDYTGPNASIVQWNFGDPDNPGAGASGPSAYYTYPDTGWYMVILTLPTAVICQDTAYFPVYVGDPGIELAFDWIFPVCQDSVVVLFNNLSTNSQGSFLSQQWYFSNGQSSETPMPLVTVYESQQIDVQLIMESSDGCIDTLVQTLDIQLLDPILPDTVLVCFHEPTELNPGFNPDWTYQWSPPEGLSAVNNPNPLANPDQTTTYSVTITDPNGPDTCSVVRSVTVLVPPPFDWYALTDTIVCEPLVVLQAQSNAAVSIVWSDTPDFSGILGNGDHFTLLSPGRPSTIYVQAEDAFGCVLTDTVLAGNYDVALAVPPSLTICIGDSVQINAINLYPEDVLTFSWAPNTGILSGQGTSTPVVSPQTTTTYTFIAGNQYGCLDTGQVQVNIFDYVPPLQVSADPDTIVAGQSSQLLAITGSTTPDPNLQYFWSPSGSLTDAGIYNPVASPTETTLYEVVILTPDGCSNRAAVWVVVVEPLCEEPYIFIPSGFSPNGDGKNEVFRVRGNFIDEVYLAVYDRWGEKVFETQDTNGGWDGTYKEKVLPPDVYGYYLRVLCFGGKEFIRKGNITLIR